MTARKWFSLSLVIVLLPTALFSGALFIYKRQVANTVDLIKSDVKIDLASGSMFAAEKRIAFLRSLGFKGLSLATEDHLSFGPKCFSNSTFPLLIDGVDVGSIVDCGEISTIFLFALQSKILLLAVLIVLGIGIAIYFIPVINYKRQVKDFIHYAQNGTLVEITDDQKGDKVIIEIMGVLQKLTKAKIELEREVFHREQQQAIARFAQQVAHDIRSPLSALNLAVAGVQRNQTESLNIITFATKRINEIASELLTRSSTEGDKIIPFSDISPIDKKNSINLLELVNNIISEKRIQFSEKSIQINCHFLAGGEVAIAIDANSISRVLSNILNNAIEAIENAPGLINVTVQATSATVVMNILDNGKGMSPDQLSKLGQFGFSQGKSGMDCGSGIGIFGSKKIINDAGGKITFHSRVGQGTTVQITLPRVVLHS